MSSGSVRRIVSDIAVAEGHAVLAVERHEPHVVVQVSTGGAEQLAVGVGHQEQRWTRIESEAIASSLPIRPPTWAFFSKTSTSKPLAASRIAAARPPIPAPITVTRFFGLADSAARASTFLFLGSVESIRCRC